MNEVEFRWIDWNINHIAEHGVETVEAEAVVRGARRPYPKKFADDRWIVIGRGRGDRPLQVIYLLDDDGTAFVIHARPLTDREKKRYRKNQP